MTRTSGLAYALIHRPCQRGATRGTKLLRENRALLEARKSTESRTRTTTRTRTIPKFRDLGLARLERSSSGNFGYEAGGALSTGGGQRSKDLPGSRAFLGFVTTGDLACDDRRAQLAFG